DYVAHHLKLAGRSDTLLSDDVLALTHRCPAAFPGASTTSPSSPSWPFAGAKAIVDESSTRAAVTEVMAE
ncbi:MAG: ExeA family protein, partial [Sciscionella sp.]